MAEFEHGGKVGVLIPCHEGQEADWVLRMRIALRGIPALDLCLGVEVPPVDPAIEIKFFMTVLSQEVRKLTVSWLVHWL